MRIYQITTGTFLTLLVMPVGTATMQGVVDAPRTPSCIEDLMNAVGREHRLERAVLFGRRSAEDAALTSVFYDREGNPWSKTGQNEWKSPADGFEDTTWTDSQMDLQIERDLLCENNDTKLQEACVQLPRRGILETRKTPTSDLIEPTVQTIRALQCRLRAVCELAAQSPGKSPGELLTISQDGCLPMTFPVMEGCREVTPDIFSTIPSHCASARLELIRREMQLLTLTLSYDASYRSLVQFAGMFQEFLTQFRFPLLEPLWQTVRMLGSLKEIPCFSSECNE